MPIVMFQFPKRLGAPYSKGDVQTMRRLAKAKFSARRAARELGRSVGGLKYAAMIRGIHFASINQKKGTQSKPSQRRKLSKLAKARS